jgi:soluble lytic murein transglycosylase-like protein
MPQYAPSFAKACGIDDFTPEDLYDPNINLLVGACHFKSLLEVTGNVASTLVAYNAGLGSDQLKQLKSLRGITNDETSGYVNRFAFLNAEVPKIIEQSQTLVATPELVVKNQPPKKMKPKK